jgi:hypothetical protein
MATPNIIEATALTPAVLVQAQLASGNNDYAVPANRAWLVKSFTLTNVSAASVTVDVLVIPTSGGTARAVLDDHVLAVNTVLVLDPAFVAMLPEAATLRITSTAATAVDVLITGVVVQ